MSPRLVSSLWLLVLIVGSTLVAFAIPNTPIKEAAASEGAHVTLNAIFDELHADMSYADIVALLGEPSDDRGSGIHIYVWPLNDGSELWIGFSDHMIYARHMENGMVKESLFDEWMLMDETDEGSAQ